MSQSIAIVPRETISSAVAPTVMADKEPGAPAAKSDMIPHPVDNNEAAPAPQSQISNFKSEIAAPSQPVASIREYLDRRKPVAWYQDEMPLFTSLPTKVKAELRQLLGSRKGQGIFGHVDELVKGGWKVSPAIADAATEFDFPNSPKRVREQYDKWKATRDWVCLVNRAKAGADWQICKIGLPLEFLKFCAGVIRRYDREDGKRQAILSIHRQWTTGRNDAGDREEIPGYGFWQQWWRKNHPDLPLPEQAPMPEGWSYNNISAQIKARNLLPKIVRALRISEAAARDHAPFVRSDRNTMGEGGGVLRFLERVEFDDVKADFLVRDEETGEICDPWLLIARCRGTALALGFDLKAATTREDGSQRHLGLKEMKQLTGWVLEHWGLPPYLCTWRLEHGTATLPESYRTFFRTNLPGRIDLSYSSMVGGKSAVGYQQRGVGNSRAKASLESHNRLMHTMLSNQPGQTGPHYAKRPADLPARAKECKEIFACAQNLPEHLRGKVGYPLLSLNQARELLHRTFRLQNERTAHELQGFEDVVEWYDADRGLWLHQSLLTEARPGMRNRKRKESPMERCARLMVPYWEKWEWPSPEILRAFYEHTIREVCVKQSGLIEFRVEDRVFEFQPAPGAVPQCPDTRLLAYFHPDQPKFVYLADGKGRIVGVWIRTTYATDAQTLSDAIAYQKSALNAARAMEAEYAAPQVAELESMRANNEALFQSNTLVPVTDAPALNKKRAALNSPSAAGLAAIPRAKQKQQRTDAADEALAKSLDEA